MSSRIQVNLQFNADVNAAKKQIDNLQSSLSAVANKTFNVQGMTGLESHLVSARQTAESLNVALHNATNMDTGRLNLNKFTVELNKMGLNVKTVAAQMRAMGPEGAKAFNQMAQAVAGAEIRIFSLQGGMRRLVNTFANTIRYQASASAINAVTSSLRNTISFAEQLDKALTDIRIVTNKSAADMAKFAKQANAAAKELSISTKEYAEASLIYFQQGLSGSEVTNRTETTVRLANAVGRSAQEVSEWMTAIWNNFDDGSKSLEYYGDVLAALGATTASSADEIAAALEKFASIADTVGA